MIEDITFEEYCEFRKRLSEQDYDVKWIELFVEKLFLNYHSAYMIGRANGIERMMYLINSTKGGKE